MTHKLTRYFVLIVVAVFGAVATVPAASSQTRGASQESRRNGLGKEATSSYAPLFVPAVAYDSGGYTATSVVVGDVNGDGKLDLVVGNRCADRGCQSGHESVGVLLGNGDGTFRAAVGYDSGGAPNFTFYVGVAIADVNGDHKPDIVVTNACGSFSCSYAGTVGVLLGNGDGTFQAAVTYGSGGSYPASVAVVDVNGDGRPDLVVTNACGDSNCDGTVGVLLGNGDGTFKPATIYGSGGVQPESVVVSDVNGDGKPDILVANNCGGSCSSYSGGVSVLLGNGDGTFKSAVTYDSGGYVIYSLAAADVNGDGKLDLLPANAWAATVGVLLGNGDGTFLTVVDYASGGLPAAQYDSVAVADVNGDGKPDLLVTTESSDKNGSPPGTVSVLLGNGDGTFQKLVSYPSGGVQTIGIAVGDVNGDGAPDVILASSCSADGFNCGGPINNIPGSVGVLLNNTGPHVPTTTSLVASVNPVPVNQPVIFTATVANQSGGPLVGMVAFKHGAATTTIPLKNNQAVYITKGYSTTGIYSVTATYSGDASDYGSASSTLKEYVGLAPTKTVLTTSGSPSHVGRPVTFTAKVRWTYGPVPNGDVVTFLDGTVVMGTGTTSAGVAKFTTASLSARSHGIKATYAGDANFKPSSGSVTQSVEKYTTKTTLTSSLNPSAYGQTVNFTAKVISAGSTPTGKVAFKDGTTWIGSATLSDGVAKLAKSNLAVGAHPITVLYEGDITSDTSASSVLKQEVQ
jgi:hypothetical protein